MSRDIRTDFDALLEFIEQYSLASFPQDEQFVDCLSQMHKKYYAFIALIFEFENMENPEVLKGKQRDFLLETVSDIGNSIFLAINGAYKPSRLILRSSIETFLKGFVIDELPNIDTEKSIYKMFEDIKAINFFDIESCKSLLDDLNSRYSTLSEDTHTARNKNMQHTSSLNYFPTKSLTELKEISTMNMKLIASFLTLLCLKFNPEFHNIHHKNRQVVIENIPKKYRSKINNIE